jgi:hypothetical protein
MKIPDLVEFSPELRKELQLDADLNARSKAVSAKVRELRAVKDNGLTPDARASRAELVRSGQPLPDSANVDAELANLMVEWRAIEDAKEIQTQRIYDARKDAARKLCQTLKPQETKLMKVLCTSLIDAHAAWSELFAMKRGVMNQGERLYGLLTADPQDLLGIPSDLSSDFHDFMRDAARSGYCRELSR